MIASKASTWVKSDLTGDAIVLRSLLHSLNFSTRLAHKIFVLILIESMDDSERSTSTTKLRTVTIDDAWDSASGV